MAQATVTKSTKDNPTKTAVALPELVELLEAGVHFGHDRSKQNPKMEPHVFMQRNRIAIFDLEKTREHLESAARFLQSLAAKPGAEILFVGTKRQARDIISRHAESVGQPYVTKRWLGGTLTNFATIQKSIEKLDQLRSEETSPTGGNLTKKERGVRRKEIERLESILEGIKNMRQLPAALLVAGSHDEKLAVREAIRMNIPVVGITDTNADPDLIDYPIPANDDAVRALELLVSTLTRAITTGQASRQPAA